MTGHEDQAEDEEDASRVFILSTSVSSIVEGQIPPPARKPVTLANENWGLSKNFCELSLYESSTRNLQSL